MDEDRCVCIALALLPELRGRAGDLLRDVDRPATLRGGSGLPIAVRARWRDDRLWQAVRTCEAAAARAGYRIVTWVDRDFPESLRRIPHPPAALWVEGTWPLPSPPRLAVVGSRRATPYGLQVVRFLLPHLIAHRIPIISGFARGIDTAVHTLCVEQQGYTIAVFGHGLQHTYPRENQKLRRTLRNGYGTLISEYPPDVPPRPELFPIRNRLISGLADVVLVVEAPARSGALNTAHWALEQGRAVLAVPGSILRTTSVGTNFLIQQGLAQAVLRWQDIARTLGIETRTHAVPLDTAEPTASDWVRELLQRIPLDEPVHIDTLIRWAHERGIDTDALYTRLLELEMADRIRSLPGRRYIRLVGK